MGWYEAIKDVITVADRLRDAELKSKLAAVQVECAQLAEENARLREERNALREKLNIRGSMQFRDDVYWQQSEDGTELGPFCPKCWGGDDKLVQMTTREVDYWQCPVCNRTVDKPGRSRSGIIDTLPFERDDPLGRY